MPKFWKLKEKIPQEIEENIVSFLSMNPHPASPLSKNNLSQRAGHLLPEGEGNLELLAQLLYNRGLIHRDQIDEFLNPRYEKLHDPFLFHDMQKAVERIWQAIDRGEKICIYGDYDADAVAANAVLKQTFRYLGQEVESYIPDRFSEGYGVNLEALEKIANSGIKMIITVDCGTNSLDAAEFCKANNIDLIITDHHEIIGASPQAYALINPKNPDDNYPYSEITGVGVAFKLACGILSNHQKVSARLSSRNPFDLAQGIRDPEMSSDLDSGHSANPAIDRNSGMTYKGGYEKWLLDLVAIGTVADCHSLLGENRILVKYGLKVLAKTRWTGLRALIKTAALDFNQKPPDTYTLGFVIAPRLNAAGRLEHANIALDLLMESKIDLAEEKALRLQAINQHRQQLTQVVLSEAKEKIITIQDRKVLVMVGEGWPKGVMGLVAGRLAEEYYKPVIVLERTAELCTGSARTAGEFNLIEALKFSSEHLVKFGGHKQAAGLSLQINKFELFYQKILEHAQTNIGENQQKVLELEAELNASQLSIVNCQLLNLLEPYGVHNVRPRFLVPNVKILSQRQVGSQSQHLQLQIKVGEKILPAIAFNFKPIEQSEVDIACELIEDGWNGRNEVKLKIVDVKKLI